MLIARVVQNEVEDELHVALVALFDELLDVGDVAVLGVDRLVVRDVVAHVDLFHRHRWHQQSFALTDLVRGEPAHIGGLEDGGEPDDVGAEGLDVVELGNDALDVSNAIAVRVAEGRGPEGASRREQGEESVEPPPRSEEGLE